MKVTIKINGEIREIDPKDLQIEDLTLSQILGKVTKLEKELKIMDDRYRKRELRLIETFKKVRGKF